MAVSKGSAPAPTALIVEDDDELRLCLTMLLQDEGYATLEAANLTQARSHLAATTPSVVVLDLMLNGENGRDLLIELAARADAPPTVIVSASRQAAEIAAEFAVALVQKPFDLDTLAAELCRARSDGRSPKR